MKVRIPATSANMGPGFDSFGLALQLYNEIEVERIEQGLVITVDGEGSEYVPLDEQNIVFQAIRYVFEKAGEEVPPLNIHIHNEVPITRGLGSSATAIVGGVLAANRLLNDRYSQQRLLTFASDLEGHPDNVSAAMLGGFVVSGQFAAGAAVLYKRFELPKEFTCVVAVPNFHLATSVSRNVLPEQVKFCDAVANIGAAGLLVAAVASGDMELLRDSMRDLIHEPYRMPLVPGMEKAVRLAREAGAFGVALSGAGPSVIAFCDENRMERIRAALFAGLAEAGTNCTTLVLKPDWNGASFVDEEKYRHSPAQTSGFEKSVRIS
ncbi:homoserine kinase [Fodinisporobacter ferrooxydans]|uniref:Homoserine kinase n=1 Tax=Fodinisporobacter ferrooxydans TaxID=2901836 RepID=A0ABY4CHY6_9BACL|nr:homoserine kinase [Alicyclobacillaceae bacterium MYW30-H2]